MVEMAFILPLVVFLVGMLITSAQLFYGKMTAQMAAYTGARAAIVMETKSQAKRIANEEASEILENGIGLVRAQDNFNFSVGAWEQGSELTYTVTTHVKTLFPVINTEFKANTVTPVTGKIVMAVERNPNRD